MNEMKKVFSDLGLELNDTEFKIMDAGLKRIYYRSDLKRAEFAEIITKKYPRTYNELEAKETYLKLFTTDKSFDWISLNTDMFSWGLLEPL